jgi:hypothetical protein
MAWRVTRAWLCAVVVAPAVLTAQTYRIRVDSRFQTVSYRGAAADSIPVAEVIVGTDGGLESPDGFAVTCVTGAAYCRFFRPGPELRGSPWVTTLDGALWGFGIRGLSVRVTGRAGFDLADPNAWYGTDPAFQLLEGILEYDLGSVRAVAGRTHVVTRLGWQGFDGVRGHLRLVDGVMDVSAWAGWGLGRGVALPVTHGALNPLDDYQPMEREVVAGVSVGAVVSRARGTVLYQRVVDPRANKFVSERAGFDGTLRLLDGLDVTAGADYDVARGHWGSWEASLQYRLAGGRASAVGGVRRYRPHFDLWTIWGVFSPVPYTSWFAAASAAPVQGLEVRARGETYRFQAAEVETPLVAEDFEDGGWRWSAGAGYAVNPSLRLSLDGHVEFGAGGASRGVQGQVLWRAIPTATVMVHAGRLLRPLEFRFHEADVWSLGGGVGWQLTERLRLDLGVARYDERRTRPDQAALDWNQLRVRAGLSVVLGAEAAGRLHPAILRIPERVTR